jgi:DNA-binding LytR/AlgR family response regulator
MREGKKYNVGVVEDEQPSLDLLLDYIGGRSELVLRCVARDGPDAVRKLTEHRCDIAFVDIDLPVCSGIEALEKVPSPPYVIFTTAYDGYAVRAFELGAVDYLLKPFGRDRFDGAVDRAMKAVDRGARSLPRAGIGLSFREGESHFLVAYDDIVYLTAHARHTVIHTVNRDFETARIIKHVEERLPRDTFLRIHKQHVVNLKYVSHFQYYIGGQYIVYMKDADSTMLPIGRRYVPAFKEMVSA